LRFSRDKRGYENTFLVQSDRRPGGNRSRILYWFRTPPGVKVGRSVLDPETRRAIEARYPDVEFDWPRILKGQNGPDAAAPPVRTIEPERRKRPRESRPPRDAESQRPRTSEPVSEPVEDARPPRAVTIDAPAEAPGNTTKAEAPAAVERAPIPDTVIPAHAILGAEGVQRLRTRYADLAARIGGRVTDEEQQQRLKELAERLNPDTWHSEDDVRRALEQYEAVLESVRAVVGQPRRRRRPDESAGNRGSESV
jgi:hypothetical protein